VVHEAETCYVDGSEHAPALDSGAQAASETVESPDHPGPPPVAGKYDVSPFQNFPLFDKNTSDPRSLVPSLKLKL
jgi:hypothetical protein